MLAVPELFQPSEAAMWVKTTPWRTLQSQQRAREEEPKKPANSLTEAPDIHMTPVGLSDISSCSNHPSRGSRILWSKNNPSLLHPARTSDPQNCEHIYDYRFRAINTQTPGRLLAGWALVDCVPLPTSLQDNLSIELLSLYSLWEGVLPAITHWTIFCHWLLKI